MFKYGKILMIVGLAPIMFIIILSLECCFGRGIGFFGSDTRIYGPDAFILGLIYYAYAYKYYILAGFSLFFTGIILIVRANKN